MLSEDGDVPVDRPNLSKDFLAGSAPDEWVSLKPESFYAENDIDLQLVTKVIKIDVADCKVMAADGQTMRVEHWVVAERQGQVVAENMLGAYLPFEDIPFFWSAHYDVTIRYVGHVEDWDAIEIDGDIVAKNFLVRYCKNGRTLAVAAIGRDLVALKQAELLAKQR